MPEFEALPSWGADLGAGGAGDDRLAATQEAELDAILAPLEIATPKQKREMWTRIGKEMARVKGAEAAAELLHATDLSQRQIAEKTGFDAATLSRLSRGSYEGGPTLWKLMALAEALGYRLELTVKPKG